MNRDEFEALQARIEARATRLWSDAGRPDGGHARFVDQARELVAIEEVDPPTLDPRKSAEPIVEEASIQGNLGEFPTLRDQGDEMTFPEPGRETDDPYAEGNIRLSDRDASATGGVLPQDDVPETDLPEVSVAAADITTSSPHANDDLGDEGPTDPADLDEDSSGEEPEEGGVTEVDIVIDPNRRAT
jgi:hypothetical protein